MMTSYEKIISKAEIESYCRRTTGLYLYQLGDLDPFFWPQTIWYGLRTRGSKRLCALVLIYNGGDIPTVMAMAERPEVTSTIALFSAVEHELPKRYFLHVNTEVKDALPCDVKARRIASYNRMVLGDTSKIRTVDCALGVGLRAGDAAELDRFYERSYPHNRLDTRLLDTHLFRGICMDGQWVAVAGVHLYSQIYRVAVLGNIATLPDYRGLGFGKKAVAAVCQRVMLNADHIGLNVDCKNAAANALYQNLGFEKNAVIEEFLVE